MTPETRALRLRVDAADARPAITPLYQTAAFQAGSPFFYSRKDNPNVAEWEQAVAALEGAPFAIATTTGMSAIQMALGLLRPGDVLAVSNLIYGCSYRLFERHVQQRGIRLVTVDFTARGPLPDKVAMVFLETPTNPFLRTVDLEDLGRRVHAQNPKGLVVVDNTWASPVFQRPLEHGADVSIHSATKFLSGHSDVMGGLVLVNRADLHQDLKEERFYTGTNLDPHAAWLLRRSLQTLPLRMREHQRVTLRMRDFLRAQPEVAHVYYPEVDGRQLTGYGGILFFALTPPYASSYETFRDSLALFMSGTGMAAVTSMVAQPYSGSHASLTEGEKAAMGLGPELVRLCFGLETPEDLEADLSNAFTRLRDSRREG